MEEMMNPKWSGRVWVGVSKQTTDDQQIVDIKHRVHVVAAQRC
jgi:hypothetical protein